ncbi:MAG: dihydroorotate dehydrogenase electron transfer subunit [Phycisphaerales bacterium]
MTNHSAKKGIFNASVLQNRALGDKFFRITLELEKKAKTIFSKAIPGQFAEIEVSTLALPSQNTIPPQFTDISKRNVILRRPFSFADIVTSNDSVIVEILYAVVGAATLRMKTLKTGDSVSILGPLGNGFSLPENKKTALLVAGGMGAPPLVHLSGLIKSKCPQTEMVVFVGTKSLSDLAFFDVKPDKFDKTKVKLGEFEKHKIKTHISTDDGSAGTKGFVTEVLKKWILENKPDVNNTIMYACGPDAMLRASAAVSAEFNIPCQVSLERRMACGTGLCQSCAVKCIDKNTREYFYKLCCKDGPVFWADEVVW